MTHPVDTRPTPVEPSGWPTVSLLTGLLLIIAAFVIFGFGLFSIVAAVQQYQAYQTGQRTQATVQALEFIPNEDEELEVYLVAFEVAAAQADGSVRTLTIEQEIRRDTFATLTEGDPVNVAFPQNAPERATLVSELRSPVSLAGGIAIYLLLGTATSATAYFLLRKAYFGLLPAWRLRRYGKLTEGRVVDRWQRESDGNTRTYVAWRFEVADRPGQHITRAEPERPRWRTLKVGDPVAVRFDPADPHNNQLWL